MAEADHSIHQFDHHPKRETTMCRKALTPARYNHSAWAIDADSPRRACRI